MSTAVEKHAEGAEGDHVAPHAPPHENLVLRVSDWILETLALSTLVVLMLLTVANAVMRYLFGAPIPGTLNVTLLYLMPAAVFLALPRVQALNAHISANLFIAKLGPIGQYVCGVISRLVIFATSLLMFTSAIGELEHSWSLWRGGFPPMPVGPSWLLACIGLAGLVIRVVWQLVTTRPERDADDTSIADFATKEFDGA
jgi:TRAP-type C4-dicarboxylate transport system permease small subunit